MISRFIAFLLVVTVFALPGMVHAQGSLRIAAAPSTRAAVEKLVAEFRSQNARANVSIVASTSGGVAALSADAADIAIVDRKAWELERRPFRQIFGHEPLGLVVGQATDRAPAVYVNSANPVKSLTLDQVARIFGTGLGDGDCLFGDQFRIIAHACDPDSARCGFATANRKRARGDVGGLSA